MISDENLDSSSKSGLSENDKTFENSKHNQINSIVQGTSNGDLPLGVPSEFEGEYAQFDRELLDRSEEMIGSIVE